MTDAAPAPVPAAPAASDGKTLGIVALIVAFFISLLGIILGFVAKSQSKKVGVKNTPATVAIVLGFIFLALQIVLFVILPLAGFGALASQCATYGPGEHLLPNGVTLTCG